MMAKKTPAQHLGRVLEAVTRQSGRLPETPAYGSWLLGTVTEDPHRPRVRIQVMLTVFPVTANLIGIAVGVLLVTVVFPVPSLFTDAVQWVTFAVAPAYVVIAFAFDTYWNSRWMVANLQWAIEQRRPSPADARNTFLAPLRMAVFHLVWWVVGAALLTTLLAPSDMMFIPKILFSVSFCGVIVATCSYLFTEFALRPAAAKALEAGPPPRRFALGIMGRTMTVWLLSSGVPVILIMLTAIFALTLRNLTMTQFGVAVLILSVATLVAGVFLMWILSGLTATSVRVVRSALRQVEQGELTTNLVVFDGTELGELQSGFNAMVNGLRERERLRDLFGRHVGREVAAAAEREQPRLGGEERHVAVVFIDIVGSTQLVTSRPATDVVQLLNRSSR